MRKKFIHHLAFIALSGMLLAGDVFVAVASADPPDASGVGASAETPDVFKNKGLTKVGFWLETAQEADIHSTANSIRALKSRLAAESSARAGMARAVEAATNSCLQTDAELRRIDAEMKGFQKNPELYNQLVDPFNNTVKLLRQRRAALDTLRKKQGSMPDSQSLYGDATLAAAKKADAATAVYEELARDAALKAAIDTYNKSKPQAIKLGPSGNFISDVAFLKKCAGDLAAEGIPVRMDGGVPVVEVIVNGKKHEMIWDSGASAVSLSAETAADFGLHATAGDREITATVADGRKVKCRLIVIPSIRVGAFTAENIEALVSPPSKVRVPDLLGGSFQHHFLCRLDQLAGVLHLTPIDKLATADKPPARPSEPLALTPANAPLASTPAPAPAPTPAPTPTPASTQTPVASAPPTFAPAATGSRPPASAFHVTILHADYGHANRRVSIAKDLQALLDADPFAPIAPGDAWAGDPAPRLRKNLQLSYQVGGQTFNVELGQKQIGTIPAIPPDGIALPGASASFKIIAARYGDEKHWIDTTPAARAEFTDPFRPVQVQNAADASFADDKREKNLAIYFEINGRRYVHITQTGHWMMLISKD